MYTLYEWLHNNYLIPKLKKHSFPHYVQQDKEQLNALLTHLPNEDARNAADLIARLREDYATAAFTYGVQFGMLLSLNANSDEL